jgi:opacity protein-like surface antigen
MRFLFLIAALALPATAHAQQADAFNGSLYSRFGMGELLTLQSNRAAAMGGGGYALASPGYTTFANPAALSDQVLTRIGFGGFYQGIEITDASDEQTLLSDGVVGPVHLTFPILDRKLGVGFQYAPYSRVSYQVRQPGVLVDSLANSSTPFTTAFRGSGGLQRVDLGVGYAPSEGLRVGATVGFLFGIIERSIRTSSEAEGFASVTQNQTTTQRGLTATLGAQYTARALLGDEDALSLGLTFAPGVHLDAERVSTLGETLDRDTLQTVRDGSTDLPWSVAGGVSYAADTRWTLTLDGRYEPWSTFESDFTFPGYAPDDASRLRDRYRISGGFEFLPAGNRPFEPYWRRVAYRLGGSFEQGYVDPVAGQSVETLALTGGLSLPTLLTGTQVDLNLEAGTRGSASGDLVRDRYYRVGLNINIGERWFQRQKLR